MVEHQHAEPRACLVVMCTKRKTLLPRPEMHFRSLDLGEASDIAAEWVSRAAQQPAQLQACRLYSGSAWQSALDAYDHARAIGPADLVIISAGFGLLNSDHLVPAYAASFSPGEDQVAHRLRGVGSAAERNRRWWNAINAVRRRPQPLAHLGIYDRVLVVLSRAYLDACWADLSSLAERVGPERLMILCCGAMTGGTSALQHCLLPLDRRFQAISPGPLHSINSRAAAWLLGAIVPTTGWDRDAMAREIESLLACGPAERLHRSGRPQSDAQVMAWLRERLSATPTAPRVELLTAFRSEGRACEQRRFRRLAHAVTAEFRPSQGRPRV
jgi:hypothetical protein